MAPALLGFCRRLGRDGRGTSAVEFALLAPMMIALYFGLAEFCQAMMADRKATHVASTVGDLVAQSSSVSRADVNDIFSVGKTIMAPFPGASLKMRISSVSMGAKDTATILWTEGSGPAYSLSNLPKSASDPTKPFISQGESVIVSQVEYTYTSPVAFFIKNGVTFKRVSYLRPRQSVSVGIL